MGNLRSVRVIWELILIGSIWRPGGKVHLVKEPAANPDDTGQKEGANSHKLFPDLSMCSVAHVFDTYSQINKSNDLKIGIR